MECRRCLAMRILSVRPSVSQTRRSKRQAYSTVTQNTAVVLLFAICYCCYSSVVTFIVVIQDYQFMVLASSNWGGGSKSSW